jgi:hypothetical protein
MTCASYATSPAPLCRIDFSLAYAGLINLRVHIINDQVACEDAARAIAPLRGLYRNVAVTRSYWDLDLGSLSRAVRWAMSFLSCALCPDAHICPVDFQLLRQKMSLLVTARTPERSAPLSVDTSWKHHSAMVR